MFVCTISFFSCTHKHQQSDSDIQTREPTYAAHTPAMCQNDCVIFTGSKNLQKFLYNRHAKTKTDAPETLWHLWVPERYNQSGFVALVKYECSPPKVDAKGDDYGTLGLSRSYKSLLAGHIISEVPSIK